MKKIGLVTGAAGGISKAISQVLIKKLDAIALIDINENELYSFTQSFSSISIPLLSEVCDISDPQSVQYSLTIIKEKIGAPNIFINAGVFYFSRELLPHMKKQSFGRIINIASMQSLFGGIGSSAYISAKHGVVGLTKAIAQNEASMEFIVMLFVQALLIRQWDRL